MTPTCCYPPNLVSPSYNLPQRSLYFSFKWPGAIQAMPDDTKGRGTGSKLTNATIVVCGVAALVASLISFLYVLMIFTFYTMQILIPIPDRYGYKRISHHDEQIMNTRINVQIGRTTASRFYSDMLSAS